MHTFETISALITTALHTLDANWLIDAQQVLLEINDADHCTFEEFYHWEDTIDTAREDIARIHGPALA